VRISVVGLGRLGAPMCACFAAKGFNVIGVDIDPKKVQDLNNRFAPVSETGLQQLLREPGLCLTATTNLESAILQTDVTFVVTATPSDSSGKFSLKYILPVCEKIGKVLARKDGFHVVAITSTVMPGDCDGPIKDVLEQTSTGVCGEQFGLVYNPEFIALGSVIKDFLNPDFVLLGANDPLSYARIAQIYESCVDSPVIKSMSRVNAELTKLALNSYITAKISFANMLARICEQLPDANVDIVTDAIGTDSRIGKKYLKGAISYGGPCFPRDNRALATLTDCPIPATIDKFNRDQIKWLADFVQDTAKGEITVLGKSYKPGTEVTEESAGVLLQQELESRNMILANTYLGNTVVIIQPDPKFATLDYSGRLVIDCWRAFPELDRPDVDYYPLGLG